LCDKHGGGSDLAPGQNYEGDHECLTGIHEGTLSCKGTLRHRGLIFTQATSKEGAGWDLNLDDQMVFFFFFFFFIVGLGFELRALHLQNRCSTACVTLQSVLLWLFWRWAS
jgi:hypothetical protein